MKKMSCSYGIWSIVFSSSSSSSSCSSSTLPSCAIFLVRFLICFVCVFWSALSFSCLLRFSFSLPFSLSTTHRTSSAKMRHKRKRLWDRFGSLSSLVCFPWFLLPLFLWPVLLDIRYASRTDTIIWHIFECVENATRSQCVKNDHLWHDAHIAHTHTLHQIYLSIYPSI